MKYSPGNVGKREHEFSVQYQDHAGTQRVRVWATTETEAIRIVAERHKGFDFKVERRAA